MITQKIGFIGCGNMGGAILSGALDSGVLKKEQVCVYDIRPEIIAQVQAMGVPTAVSNESLSEQCDIIILAVKPQNAAEALGSTGRMLTGKAVISIVAGWTTEKLESCISGQARVLRTMPNTPALVFEGAFAFCSDNDLREEEKAAATGLFEAIGIVEWIPEKLMDAVCGLSGGGPAYTAMFIEALADGAVKQGLPRATAYRLASQTVMGTAKMILEKDIHPGELKDMVTSPGGTTIEGCERLEKGGMRYAVMDCVRAATEKGKQL